MLDGVHFTQVSAQNDISLAIGDNGNIYAWGWNKDGLLGVDSTISVINAPRKVKTPEGIKFTQVSAGGDYHSLAIGDDGNTYAWGFNDTGQLGNNSTDDSTVPVKVTMPEGVKFTQVSAGWGHSLAIGDDGNTYAWGYNYYGQLGNNSTDNDAHPTPVQVKASVPGVSVDPTAVPVEPVSTTSDGSDTTRVYTLPYTVNPGGYVIYHFNGTVDRTTAEQLIHNQAWFDSPDTPYAVDSGGEITQGVPHALGRTSTVPDKPDDAKLDRNSHDVTGNQSCMTGSDYSKPDMEHWFSTSAEDQCDQVGAVIPATSSEPVLGSISGLYWRDMNKDGIRQETETDRIPGQQVILEDTDGRQLATTVTDGKGEYKFDKLKLATYRVRFSRVTRADFTEVDANDPTKDAATNTDGSSTDSDAGTSDDDYGMGTPTITLTEQAKDKEHVDAGVLADKPYTSMLPFTGVIILPLVLLVSIGFLAGAIILLREPKHGDDSNGVATAEMSQDSDVDGADGASADDVGSAMDASVHSSTVDASSDGTL